MAMKYTQIPATTFERLQLNAGILVDSFDPETGTIGNLLGATTGGIQFSTNPEFSDFGEDIDNCPNNMKELKRLMSYDATLSGTFLTVTPAEIKALLPAGSVSGISIIPSTDLAATDFREIWWVGDYSDNNVGSGAGFLAIKMMNALNTAGFQIQSTKDGKGQMAFEYHAHYSMNDQTTVPFAIYCSAGSSSATPSVNLSQHYIQLAVGDEVLLGCSVTGSTQSVSWSSGSTTIATVSNGTIEGKQAGNTIITASITDGGVTYNDTCTVKVVSG